MRIGAGRLVDVAKALGVHISYFFEEASPPPDDAGRPLTGTQDSFAMTRAFGWIGDPAVRQKG